MAAPTKQEIEQALSESQALQRTADENLKKLNSTLDKLKAPAKAYVYPSTLDTIPNTNCIIFKIYGDDDIGKDLTKSQRINGQSKDAIMGTINGVKKSVNGLTSLVTDPSTVINSAKALGSDVAEAWSLPEMRDFGIKDSPRLLDILIKLPMPEEGLNTKYSMSYESTALGLGGALVDTLATGSSLSDLIKTARGPALRALAGFVTGQLGDLTTGNKAFINPEATFEAATRTVLNPRKEQLFKSVNYRVFDYVHTFAPANKAECDTVSKLIHIFKLHMHPLLEMQGFYLRYPSEFEITYQYNDTDNPYLHKIGRCALTDFSVSYGRGNWSTLINGMPTTVSTHMTFQELEPLTKNRIFAEGY